MFRLGSTASLVAILLLVGFTTQFIKVIPEGRVGVVFNLKDGVQDKALKEGLHFLIPAIQTLIVFDTRIQTYTFSNNNAETTMGKAIIAKTRDGQKAEIDVSFIARMLPEKAPDVYQKLRTDYISVIKSKAGKVMQEVIARHVADALYTETRKIVAQETKEYLAKSFSESGFELYDVLLRKIDFSDDYIQAIEAKQIALQKAELARIRKQIAEKDKKISIIQGEAEAKTLAIKGRALQANPRIAELEYIESIESSGLNPPVISGLKSGTIINLDKALSPAISSPALK